MQAMLNALSSFRAWQIGVLVAVLAAGFGASGKGEGSPGTAAS